MKMIIFTNENNTATLKLLVAAHLGGKKPEVRKVSLGDPSLPGPRSLPQLQVDDQLQFFSSNAAAQYLFPVIDLAENGQCQQLQEWEATRLHPAVSAVVSSKTAAADTKQVLQALLQTLDSWLKNQPYVLGDKLSAADVTIWSALYPIWGNDDLRKQYVSECANVAKWAEQIGQMAAVQVAVKEWNGNSSSPLAQTSVLGAPQLASPLSPTGSPEEGGEGGEGAESRPSAEEVAAARDGWRGTLPPPPQAHRIPMPVKGRRNVLVTSALPYVNNVPHLGNIIGCVLSADIFARYCRICDYNTLFICGTDEYGTATETKALEEGVTPREICDKYFAIHSAVYEWFEIAFDHFGRTSTPQQTEIAQRLFLKLMDNGFISSQSVDQLLCEKCDRFLADRFVEGICPHVGCGYDGARGDQCDKCGKLINATELIQPRCKVCGATPVVRPSEQLFLELGQLEPSLRSWIAANSEAWSAAARAVTRSWLRDTLRPRAITRDLKWGVPTPIEKYKNKVFYVWFDAPIGYMSITECFTKQYEAWWKPDKEYDVKLYQFMAKDNVPFHVIMFPATIIGVNEGHVLVNHVFATEYLNYEEGKFSKSRGVGVFGTDAQDTGIPADVWRFYLASIRPETSDSSFSWAELGTRNNSELLNNLGNFCHRSLSFCCNSFKGIVPEVTLTQQDYELIALVNRDIQAYVSHMERGRLRWALRSVLVTSRRGNQLMQAEQPWVGVKGSEQDRERAASVIGLCCQLVALLSTLLAPFMPATARRLREQLNVEASALRLQSDKPYLIRYLPPGHTLGKPEPLFAKIDPERLEELKRKYAGTQAERARQNGDVNAGSSVAELEKAIAEQGEKVRKLKASTKDKSVWQPEVNKLLELKKQLVIAQAGASGAAASAGVATAGSVDVGALERAVTEQGEKVRQLKASTKDKSVWQPEINKLLDLKKQLAAAQTAKDKGSEGRQGPDAAALEKAIVEQGEKVRKLKASTKDKAAWQPEVNILLDLKKQLASLQVK